MHRTLHLQQLTTDFPFQITSETSLRNVQTTKTEKTNPNPKLYSVFKG